MGDPVDVVTGALEEATTDFKIASDLPVEWRRHYSSQRTNIDRGLGLGHGHELDHRLKFDLDGVIHLAPSGLETSFDHLDSDGTTEGNGSFTLFRVNGLEYRLEHAGKPDLVFQRVNVPGKMVQHARLTRIEQGKLATRLAYYPDGQLASITDCQGRQLVLRYVDSVHIASINLERGATTAEQMLIQYRYDAGGRLVEGKDAYNQVFRIQYDAEGRMARRTDRRGFSVCFEYDTEGRCVRSGGEDGVFEVRLRYEPTKRQTVVTQPGGGDWTYIYDETGDILQIIDPYGGKKTYVKDDSGEIAAEYDPKGAMARWLYQDGAPIGKSDDLGRVVPLDGHTASGGKPHLVDTCAVHWEHGDRQEEGAIVLPTPRALPFELPEQVRAFILATEDPAKGLVQEESDAQGLRLRQLRLGQRRTWAYDPNGNVRRYTDFDGGTRTFGYASWNHQVEEADALGRTTRREFTKAEKLAALIDPGGTRSEYSYDLRDRLTEVKRNGRVRERYVYDAADNLIEKRDGNDQPLVQFTYGQNNLCIERKLTSGDTHTFRHNQRGQIIEANGAAGKLELIYTYDGRRGRDAQDGLGVDSHYGPSGLVATEVLGKFRTTYERLGEHNSEIVDPTGKKHRVRQLASGLFIRELANGTHEVSQYDLMGRNVLKVAYDPGRPESGWQRIHELSGEGDVLATRDNVRGTTRYKHNAAHQISAIERPDGSFDAVEYDVAGNVVGMPGLVDASIGTGNRLLAANGAAFEYNDRDHISVRRGPEGTTRYHYDSRDQLVRIELSDRTEWRAEYDPLGRRTKKHVGDQTWTYYWDGDRLAVELRPDGSLRIYIYPDTRAMVPLLWVHYASIDADSASGQVFYPLCNQLGAPEVVQDSSGKTVWRAHYDPYGRCHIELGADHAQTLRMPGHFYDDETGLHYNRFRYYAPELARYLQSDPWGITGGDNLYAYTDNPLRQVDVRGLSCPNGDCDGEKESSPVNESESGPERESNQPRGRILFRSMREAPDGRPEVGPSARTLGSGSQHRHGERMDGPGLARSRD